MPVEENIQEENHYTVVKSTKPSKLVVFHKDGKDIGWLDIDKDNMMVFGGKLRESAELFFQEIVKNYCIARIKGEI